jgi:hypothetical protein
MVACGQARWLASWRDDPGTGGLALASWDGTDFATEQVAARVSSFAVDPTEANESWLLDHLRSLGIDPGKPVDLTIGHEAPSTRAGNATAPGDTVVIRPMSEPKKVRNDRTLIAIMSCVGLALELTPLAVIVGSIPDDPSHQSPYQSTPIIGRYPFIPTYSYPALPGPALGEIEGCPPPLLAGECNTILLEPGNTLRQLACAYRTTVAVLQQMNNLSGSTEIDARETLTVPYQQDGPASCG